MKTRHPSVTSSMQSRRYARRLVDDKPLQALVIVGALLIGVSGTAHAQADAAREAYRSTLEAFERGDARGYFGSFARRQVCFYGGPGVPLARIRAQRGPLLARNRRSPGSYRLESEELRVELEAEDRVLLRDRGRYGRRGRERTHSKLVLMVRSDGRWRIAGEAGPRSRCYGELLRSETVTGVDPLTTEDGAFAALGRDADLVRRGRGVVSVRFDAAGRPRASCVSVPWRLWREPRRDAFSCDAAITRCVLGEHVYRFSRAEGHRQLLAVVTYPDANAAPTQESPAVEALLRGRDTLCELHDRLYLGDPSLASDDVWQLVGMYTRYRRPRHLCGAEARRVSTRLVRHFAGSPPLLRCSELFCRHALSGTGDPHVEARRVDGRLQIAVDGTDWILGDRLSARDRHRVETKRCPRPP